MINSKTQRIIKKSIVPDKATISYCYDFSLIHAKVVKTYHIDILNKIEYNSKYKYSKELL